MLTIGMSFILEDQNSVQTVKYKSKVVDYTNEEVFIDYPINLDTHKLSYFQEGTALSVTFLANDQHTYRFQTTIIRMHRDNIPMLVLHYPGDSFLTKIQRREFVRVRASTDVMVGTNRFDQAFVKGITVDISAGGAAFVIPDTFRLPNDQHLVLLFELPMNNGDKKALRMNAKIVRKQPLTNSDKLKVSVEYVNVTNHDRQLILKFCFERQLEERKRIVAD